MSAARKLRRRLNIDEQLGSWEKRPVTPEQWSAYGISPLRRRPYAMVNRLYSVQLSDEACDWGLVTHLWVRRHDDQPIRSWSHMQRVKNECLDDGPLRIAVEVYPRADEVVDAANMYHLWVLPVGFALPFRLHGATS